MQGTDYGDLFAGPGGWAEGGRLLGLTETGVELDAWACRTAEAAGHARVQGDVRTVQLDLHRGWRGLAASPVCAPYSAAGNAPGDRDLPHLVLAIKRLAAGEWPAEQIAACEDDASALSLEPLRWALFLRPEWLVLEQVTGVRPLWEATAAVLQELGYSVDTGPLQAEQYGVPQTRRREVLVANRTRSVALPAPTHRRYNYRLTREQGDQSLQPWVSMADALPDLGLPDWCHARPATTIVASYGSNKVAGPGWRTKGDASRQDAPGTVKVTPAQAGILQSFRPDYPWQGPPTKQHQQVGMAVPPLLARAVLEAAGAADHLTA